MSTTLPQEPSPPPTKQERIREATKRMIAVHEVTLRKLELARIAKP